MTKLRVIVDGKVVAYEMIRHDKITNAGDRWHWRGADWDGDDWVRGTYEHTGIRECFTGRVDKNGVEIYEGDSFCYTQQRPVEGIVAWNNDESCWYVYRDKNCTDPAGELSVFYNTYLKVYTKVIPEQSDEI